MSHLGERILLVEDDRAFARSTERRLSAEGYDVTHAADGREGMRSIVTREPQLVLSDWLMPHVDGLELCQAVKTGLGDEAPFFILFTAKDDRDARALALESGADDYVLKTCHPGELFARIRNGMHRVAVRAELKRVRAELDALRAGVDPGPVAVPRLSEPLTLCRPCGKVRIAEGVWEDLAHLIEDMGFMGFETGRCPDCEDAGAAGTDTDIPGRRAA